MDLRISPASARALWRLHIADAHDRLNRGEDPDTVTDRFLRTVQPLLAIATKLDPVKPQLPAQPSSVAHDGPAAPFDLRV